MNSDYKIEDFNGQLQQLCPACRKFLKCNHEKICAFKKMAFLMAKRKLAKNKKLLEERS